MKRKLTLRAARVNINLTQKQVAEKLGVHFQTIRNWENGQITPSAESLLKLAELYGIKVNDFQLV